MNIFYPLIKGQAGGDIYCEILSRAMSQLDIESKIKYYHPIAGIIPPLFRYASKNINIESYDIIHSNADYGYIFKSDKPLVITSHHLTFGDQYQRYTSFIEKTYHKIIFYYTRKSLSDADCIVAVSNNTKDDIEKIFGITDVRVIYNGVDSEIFKPLNVTDICPDKIKILFVGNLTKRKGADLLPKIMKILDDRFILYYTSGLRTKYRFSNTKMIPLGTLSLDRLVEMYNICDIVISPSRLEGFGYSVAEAMSCKKPVIATNCSSLPELIDDGMGGFLCDIDNVAMFSKKITVLGDDDNLRKDMGIYNRNKILKKFNIDKMSKEYAKLYRKIL